MRAVVLAFLFDRESVFEADLPLKPTPNTVYHQTVLEPMEQIPFRGCKT